QHIDPTHESMLADILARRTALAVRRATSGQTLEAGVVHVAPPGSHMEIVADPLGPRVSLTHSEPLHFVRPSADRLFESAPAACGPIIGVVLTGNGTDGARGVQAIKRAGGIVIVQAPAQFDGMPRAAIETGAVDYELPLDQIAAALVRLTATTEADERDRP